MSRNEKKGHGGKHTRPKKWSGARRPAGPATTALRVSACVRNSNMSFEGVVKSAFNIMWADVLEVLILVLG